MKSLQEATLSIVCSNIEYSWKICQTFNWKIPKVIGNKIMTNLRNQRSLLRKEELTFFDPSIIEFTEFHPGRQFFKNDNYDFLHGRQLNNFILNDLKKFSFNLVNSKITTKNFHVKDVKFMDFDFNKMGNFFQNILTVTESIAIEDIYDESFFKTLLIVIEKSSNSIKKLSFKNCCINKDMQSTFLKVIGKVSTLESLEFLFDKSNFEQAIINIANSTFTHFKNLKNVSLLGCNCGPQFLIDVFQKTDKLEEIILEINQTDEFLVLYELKKRHSNSLKRMSLHFQRLSGKNLFELGELFKNCKKLTYVTVQSINMNDPEFLSVLDGLRYLADKLENLFPFPYLKKNENFIQKWKQFFRECKSLREIDLEECDDISDVIEPLMDAIRNSKDTLHTIKLNKIESPHKISLLKTIKEVKNLETFSVKHVCTTDSFLVLTDIIQLNKFNLKSLYMRDVELEADGANGEKFMTTISTCPNIKILSLENFTGVEKLHRLISETCAFIVDLEELSIMGTYLSVSYWSDVCKGLNLCRNLKSLNFNNSLLGKYDLSDLLKKLVTSKFTLESLKLPTISEKLMSETIRYFICSCLSVKVENDYY